MRILVLSPYHANSHHRWLTGLEAHFPHHEWTTITLPPRAFCWRYVGNAYSLADRFGEQLNQDYDVLLATSMTNLAVLKALVPKLAKIRTILYFHENQFDYPSRYAEAEQNRFHYCMQSIYSAMMADQLVFNSQYNHDSFFKGARTLLKKMRDYAPRTPLRRLEQNAVVLPVPLDVHWFQNPQAQEGPLRILWNHRWEYDKAPERFFNALKRLASAKQPFEVYVVGQSFQTKPSCFEQAKQWLKPHIQAWGYLESAQAYRELLPRMDVVVSTALHEFQGLSVLEAAASGCHVLTPNRLAYPEWFGPESLYPSSPEDPAQEEKALADALTEKIESLERLRQSSPPQVSALSWTSLAPKYAAALDGKS